MSPPPPGVMVLGPSDWLSAGLPSNLKLEGITPLEARRMVTSFLRDIGINAVLMEEHAPTDGETNFRLFLRLVGTHNVRTYLLVWPLGSKLHGASIEMGYLLKMITSEQLEPDDVFMLVEQGTFEIEEDADGELVLSTSEKGNRSRYYADFGDEGCPMLVWDNSVALKLLALNVAMAHAARHGFGSVVEQAVVGTQHLARAEEKGS